MGLALHLAYEAALRGQDNALKKRHALPCTRLTTAAINPKLQTEGTQQGDIETVAKDDRHLVVDSVREPVAQKRHFI